MTEDTTRRIGDYEILGVLGSGGMGKVFKVRNVISDRIEAMKVLLPDLAGQQELADRFLREIKLLASLDHPNIAQLRTALTLSNRLVMVMEYVEGTTLAARLEQGPIPPGEAMGYIKQVLTALAYAHQRNVIHRDIKPANMMLTPTGTVKLMDFGIARASGDASMTVTGTTVGSLFYMSPEQVKGGVVDARSDLYSLGVSLYEMVTGQRPFKASSDYSLMTAQLQERPKPPSELQAGLPPELNGVILHSMAKDPANRFQSAEEFSEALNAIGLTAPAAAVSLPAPGIVSTPTAATSVITAAPEPISATMSIPVPPPYQPTPIPSVMDMSPKPSKGRGLYMALGAVIVLFVLVLAGLSVPRWIKARANEQKQADQNAASSQSNPQTSNSTSSNPPPSDNSSSAKPEDKDTGSKTDSTSGASAGNSTSSDSAGSPKSGGESSSDKSASNSGGESSANSAGNSSDGRSTGAGEKKQAKSKHSGTGGATSSGDQGTTTASNDTKSGGGAGSSPELEELEQDVDQTSSRANAASNTLDTMRRQLSSQGLNLRADISSSEELVKTNLDRAQQALQNHDSKSARKYLSLAQANMEKIEKFLGH